MSVYAIFVFFTERKRRSGREIKREWETDPGKERKRETESGREIKREWETDTGKEKERDREWERDKE